MYKTGFFKIVSFLVFCHYGYSQDLQISGMITEEEGLPFAGAIVNNLATKDQVTANFDGEFEIKAHLGDTLQFLGHKNFEHCYEPIYKSIINNSPLHIQLLSKEWLKYEKCKDKPKELFIFIGKLIGSEDDNSYDDCYIRPNTFITADFQIIEQFYGDLNLERLEFKDSDHASAVPFPYLNTKFSLFLVEKFCGEFYLRSSRDIYQTKTGQWALLYHPDNYLNIENGSSHIQKIPFINNLKFKGTYIPDNRYSEFFKEPYYEYKRNYFKPLMGNYVKDYVDLWIKNDPQFRKDSMKD